MKFSTLAAAAILIFLSCTTVFSAEGFLTADGSKLLLDGRLYRAIGVNMPNLLQAYNGTWLHTPGIYKTPENAKQAMIDGILDAERNKVAFIRFFAGPGYPHEIDLLYAKDKESYWRRMDEIVALCREHQLKLIPSLNMVDTWQPYFNEVGQAVLDPKSKSHQASYDYIREFVTRYKDEPTILMWEIANETMLAADVDRQDQDRLPSVCYTPGKEFRAKGVREDSLTWNMVLQIYEEQTEFIKSIDKNHLVTSGDAAVRQECTSRRETFPDFKYRNDTLRQWLANNLASQPEPLDVFSYHIYGSGTEAKDRENTFGIPWLEVGQILIQTSHAAGAPVFIGEFGQGSPDYAADPASTYTLKFIDMMDKEQVSLAALWVWHFPWQPQNNVTGDSNPPLMKRIEKFNKKYARIR